MPDAGRKRNIVKLSDFQAEKRQLSVDELLAEIEAEEDGSCPARAWCFAKRLRVSKHAWCYYTKDGWRHYKCGFGQHHALWQCRESGNGHGRIPDRGIAEARCAGAAFCGKATCHHAAPHRWKADDGCDRIECRELARALEKWDEETRGERPDIGAVVICEWIREGGLTSAGGD